MNRTKALKDRISGLGVRPQELGLGDQLEFLSLLESEGSWDDSIEELVLELIARREDELESRGFVEPNGSVDGLLVLEDGTKVSVDVGSKDFGHLLLAGGTGMGKTVLQSALIAKAAKRQDSLFFLTNPSALSHRGLRDSSNVLFSRDLSFNFFETPKGVNPAVADAAFVDLLGRSFSLQYGRFELRQVVSEIRSEGLTPSLSDVVMRLKRDGTGGFRRKQYREAALVVSWNALDSTGGLFGGGMSVSDLLSGNWVVVMELTPEFQSLFVSWLFVYLGLLAKDGGSVGGLVFGVDEGQLVGDMDNFAERLLEARHAGLSVVLGLQNASRARQELVSNMSLVSFRQTDRRDTSSLAGAMNLSRDQEDVLSVLSRGECLAFLPGSRWIRSFRARVEDQDLEPADLSSLRDRSRVLAQELRRKGVPAGVGAGSSLDPGSGVGGVGDGLGNGSGGECGAGVGVGSSGSGVGGVLDVVDRAFLGVICNESFLGLKAGEVWERAGVRSASEQQRVKRRLVAEGWVVVHELEWGRGRPRKLFEPTKVALEAMAVSWSPCRGGFLVRVVTKVVEDCLVGLGWSVDREASPVRGGKQVDLLCRRGGVVLGVEVAGSSAHEVHNSLWLDGRVDFAVVVGVSRDVVGKVRERFSGFEGLEAGLGDGRLFVWGLGEALGNSGLAGLVGGE